MNENILLCGNPNVGKSSLFNILTHSHEHTGNWTGKTVELASKKIKKTYYTLVDLPGIYSLSDLSDEEKITKNTLLFDDYEKIIYVCGYGDQKRWKKVLGGQVGCVYLDEVNLANMEFMREITHRCKYMMTTSNPDDPNLEIYKEFINSLIPILFLVEHLIILIFKMLSSFL